MKSASHPHQELSKHGYLGNIEYHRVARFAIYQVSESSDEDVFCVGLIERASIEFECARLLNVYDRHGQNTLFLPRLSEISYSVGS
jgi:hypothetical protein